MEALAAVESTVTATSNVVQKAVLKFPASLKKFVEGVTVIPELLKHTEVQLQIHRFDPSLWVSAMMSQVEENSTVSDWVMTNIYKLNLNWEQAKVAM
jgi:hypothetical protein